MKARENAAWRKSHIVPYFEHPKYAKEAYCYEILRWSIGNKWIEKSPQEDKWMLDYIAFYFIILRHYNCKESRFYPKIGCKFITFLDFIIVSNSILETKKLTRNSESAA